MELKKWSPWNWFKSEEEQEGRKVPSSSAQQPADHPITRMHQEVDRMFDEAFRNFGLPSMFSGEQGRLFDRPAWLKPSVDIQEKKKEYRISVEVPGVSEDELDLEVVGDTLIIRGEKKQEDEETEGDFHRIERAYGAFQRMLTLPANADSDNIKAKFKNGVLRITIPKTSESGGFGRSIKIERG